jgi:hypothetical protein
MCHGDFVGIFIEGRRRILELRTNRSRKWNFVMRALALILGTSKVEYETLGSRVVRNRLLRRKLAVGRGGEAIDDGRDAGGIES